MTVTDILVYPLVRVAVAVSVLAALALCRAPAAREEAGRAGLPEWLERTQTWCTVPVLPETAAKLHVSVNGVWAGVSGMDPILTHREIVPAVQATYGAD